MGRGTEIEFVTSTGKKVTIAFDITAPDESVGMIGYGYENDYYTDDNGDDIKLTEKEMKEVENRIIKYLENFIPDDTDYEEPYWR